MWQASSRMSARLWKTIVGLPPSLNKFSLSYKLCNTPFDTCKCLNRLRVTWIMWMLFMAWLLHTSFHFKSSSRRFRLMNARWGLSRHKNRASFKSFGRKLQWGCEAQNYDYGESTEYQLTSCDTYIVSNYESIYHHALMKDYQWSALGTSSHATCHIVAEYT
jgi:hypothetical protein